MEERSGFKEREGRKKPAERAASSRSAGMSSLRGDLRRIRQPVLAGMGSWSSRKALLQLGGSGEGRWAAGASSRSLGTGRAAQEAGGPVRMLLLFGAIIILRTVSTIGTDSITTVTITITTIFIALLQIITTITSIIVTIVTTIINFSS